MQASDPYKTLGLGANASQAQIKKQYLKLAKKYHPDIHGDTPYFSTKFSEINHAYQTLSNPPLKTKHDKGKTASKHTRFKAHPLSDKYHFQIDIPFITATLGEQIKVMIATYDKSFLIKVPPLSEQDMVLKIPHAIKSGFFKTKQNLYFHLNILPHPTIQRKNLDLFMTVPISLSELFSKEKLKIPLLNSSIQVQLPELKAPQSQIRVKNKGLTRQNQTGHLYLDLQLQLPKKPNTELKKFLQNWESQHPYLKRD